MKLLLYCNERAVGSLDTDGDASAPVNPPARNAWQLQFDTAPSTPLSPHLSAAAGAVVNAPAVRDFFVNYLPEPPHAERVARSFTPPPRTGAELLAALGQELTGAFALAPGALGNARYAPLAFDAFEERVAASRRSADVIAFAPHAPRLSLAGAQDKFALWYDPQAADPDARLKIPLGRAASTHIFKPASTDSRFALLPANEFACARLAAVCGLPVAETRIATFGGVRVLVVARFDRVKRGAAVTRLHQIDLCQMLNTSRERKYGSEGGIDTAELFDACRYTRVPALSRRMLLRAWLFNFLIGNADAHAKNHSFLWQHAAAIHSTADGALDFTAASASAAAPVPAQWQAAPLYDLLSVTPYLPSQPQSMGLLDEYRPGWFEAVHWRELARLAGVTPAYLAAEAKRMIEVMQRTAPALALELRAALTPDELDFLAERVNPVVRERCTWLQQALV